MWTSTYFHKGYWTGQYWPPRAGEVEPGQTPDPSLFVRVQAEPTRIAVPYEPSTVWVPPDATEILG